MKAASIGVRLASPADRPGWDAFVVARQEGDPLQTWIWGDIMATIGERPARLIAERGGSVVGLAAALVREAGFGRTVVYVPHGPLWLREDPAAPAILTALLEALRDLGRAERAIVVKFDPRSLAGSGPEAVRSELAATGIGLRPARHDLQAPVTEIIDLRDGGEELRASWDADARRRSKRSGREGVAVEIDRRGDPSAVGAFAAILAETAARGGFRARSAPFLQLVAEGFAGTSGWYLPLARRDGRVIAGIAAPRVGDRAYYLYAASLREPELVHAYGGYAVMAALLEAAWRDGVRTFDVWGVADPVAGPDSSWAGFSAFKRMWGGATLRHAGTFDLVVAPGWYEVRDLRERLRERLATRKTGTPPGAGPGTPTGSPASAAGQEG